MIRSSGKCGAAATTTGTQVGLENCCHNLLKKKLKKIYIGNSDDIHNGNHTEQNIL